MSAIVSRLAAGVVHRADDGRFTLFDVAAGDDPVHRRLDDDLRHVVAGRRQARLLLLDLLFARFDFLLPRGDLLLAPLDVGLSHGDLVLRALERLAVVRPSFHRSCWRFRFCCDEFEGGLRLLAGCLRRGDADARLSQARLGGGDGRLAALQLPFELPRVDLEQELARLDALAFLDGQPRDSAHLVAPRC